MKSLFILIALLVLVYLIVAQGKHIIFPRSTINPGWANMRYDDPWFGKRHFTEP